MVDADASGVLFTANPRTGRRDETVIDAVHGLGVGPDFVHIKTAGRKEVERISGQDTVPVLVTDDGEVITDSKRIVTWAEAKPASGPE